MKIVKLPLGPLPTNTYVVKDEKQQHAVVIDPAADSPQLLREIENFTVEAILLTHAHFDHIAGLNKIRELTGAPVYLHRAEHDWLTDPMKNGSGRWPEVTGPIVCDPADHAFHDEEILTFLQKEWRVMYTPGHSPGGVSLLMEGQVFSGDALFAQSIGRTDLPGGNYEQLIISIQDKLMTLPDEITVYPGHGPATTVGREKEANPYITGILR